MRLSTAPLNRLERYTWRRHRPAQVFNGLEDGILGLASFVALRSLGAPAWIAPLMVVLAQAPWILSPMWEQAISRMPPHRAFRWFGVGLGLPLVAMALVGVTPTGDEGHGSGDYVLFLALYVLAHLVIGGSIAQRGAMIRTNYRNEVRGSVFGLLQVLGQSASIATAKLSGALLNADPRFLRVLFPLAGVLGFLGQLRLSTIRWKRGGRTGRPREGGPGFREAWKRSARLLRDDRDFMVYQVAWSLYGMGFLMSTPMIVVFGESRLGLSYNDWTWAQGVAFPLASILAVAPVGRLVDRLGPVRMTALAFFLLVGFFAALPLVRTAPQVIAAFAFWGVAMAGVGIVWNVGPLAFAPEGRGRHYAAAHVAIVGVRSLLAPLLGYLVAELLSIEVLFLVTAALVLAGGVVAWRLHARCADRLRAM